MKKIQEVILIILCCSLMFTPLFIREQPLGIDDPYYFFNYITHKTHSLPETTGITTHLIFDHLPSSITWITIILLISFIISMIIFYHICRIYSKEYAIYTTLALMVFLFFSGLFFRLEDDAYGIPFMFLSLFFITRYQFKNRNMIEDKTTFFNTFDSNILLSLVFLFISVLIWRFTVFLIPIYCIITNWNRIYLFFAVAVLPFIYSYIIPNFIYQEGQPLNAIAGIFFLIPLFWVFKESKNKWGIVVLTIMALLVNKFILLLTPVFMLDLNLFLNKYWSSRVKNILIYLLIVFFCASVYTIYTGVPTSKQSHLFDQVKDMNEPVVINWSYGYYAIWKGIDVNVYGHAQPQDYNGYVLTNKLDPKIKKCKEKESADALALYYC